jgi:ketosteroid isomerase-like protein
MSAKENVQVVKDFFAVMGSGDKQRLLALVAEDIEWIIPGEDWPLAGTHRGHAGLADLLQKASKMVETSFPEPPEFVAQGDRVLVVGFARGRIKATNKTSADAVPTGLSTWDAAFLKALYNTNQQWKMQRSQIFESMLRDLAH